MAWWDLETFCLGLMFVLSAVMTFGVRTAPIAVISPVVYIL